MKVRHQAHLIKLTSACRDTHFAKGAAKRLNIVIRDVFTINHTAAVVIPVCFGILGMGYALMAAPNEEDRAAADCRSAARDT